ncbi:DUF1349 domain-containing protein [Xanthovirga aplysinae]|uniref:DUF1349 domain-containing protein n=1 Tax=Xanthovirga aplysinae TaxID=2529853 RepID=UPI0012BB5386|nr:DUF1349 domain-containing protein [Xanthovirga aplysinae]MTI33168.1 DUF1349 domain-containing protein [Xanthovirga aplysinae]
MRRRNLLLVFLLFFLSQTVFAKSSFFADLNTTNKGKYEVQKDSLSLEAIPYSLEWVNKGKSAKVLSENSFSLTTSGGTDLYNFAGGGPGKTNAPILAFPADESFVLTSKVQVGFGKPFDGGSLVMYEDSLHYTKLMFEKGHDGKLVISTGVTKTFTDDHISNEIKAQEIFLRIAKAGDLNIFYYSLDGKDWKLLRIFRFHNNGNLKLGFSVQSPDGENCTAVFSEINYSPQPFKDFWTGN